MTISQLNKITTPVLWDIETKYYENNDYLWTTKRKITMNDLLCKLPIGIQTFEKLRKGDYLYVDKTELVWKIAYISTPYFLSRPRRFGKSLLLSTFEAYFEGKKERTLRRACHWKVGNGIGKASCLHLDLNAEKYDSPERLYDILSHQLTLWEIQYGKGIDVNTLSSRFSGLIHRAYEQTGSSVGVLIDEYDKPLLQFPNDEVRYGFMNFLVPFYTGVKNNVQGWNYQESPISTPDNNFSYEQEPKVNNRSTLYLPWFPTDKLQTSVHVPSRLRLPKDDNQS